MSSALSKYRADSRNARAMARRDLPSSPPLYGLAEIRDFILTAPRGVIAAHARRRLPTA